MAQSYSFFHGIPVDIPDTYCIEQTVNHDYSSYYTRCIASHANDASTDVDCHPLYDITVSENDFASSTPSPYCNCGDANCSVNSMSSIQKEQITRTLDFHDYFPDLFLNDVPLYYTISDIYNVFNSLCNDIVLTIIIVPGATSNKFVVKFHSFNISRDTYDKTICMRWAFYKGLSYDDDDTRKGKWFELDNVCPFDSNKWSEQLRFGVEYHYPLNSYASLFNDQRTVHLFNYLKQMNFERILTDDAFDFICKNNERIAEESNEVYDTYLNADSQFDVAHACAKNILEDGEIDESYLYHDISEGSSVSSSLNNEYHDINSYKNYIHDIINNVANDEIITNKYNIVHHPVHPVHPAALDSDKEDAEYYEQLYAEEQRNGAGGESSLGTYDDDYYDVTKQDDSDSDDDDDNMYECCEISNGIWHRRICDPDEDRDELYRKINNATNMHERVNAFWN